MQNALSPVSASSLGQANLDGFRCIAFRIMTSEAPDGPVRQDLRYSEDSGAILAHASRLKGRTLDEILERLGDPDLARGFREGRGKSGAGLIIEACFGIPPNPSSEPDFPRCGIELKTLPLIRTGSGYRVKERTSISMIDYFELVRENWETASVRRKLSSILFVFVVVNRGAPGLSYVLDFQLWSPGETDQALFQLDWTWTHDRVVDGLAHELSEADEWALAASRKGAGKEKDLVSQPNNREILAQRRAFTLKPTFTSWVFSDLLGKRRSESIIEKILPEVRSRGFNVAEQRVLNALSELQGFSLGRIATKFNIELGDGKSLAANLIKRVLKFTDPSAKIREFEQLGIQVKTIHLRNRDGRPFESVSFPVVDLQQLVNEDWEGTELAEEGTSEGRCDLIDQVRRILFVSTYSDHKNDPQGRRVLGKSFFWSPTIKQFATIESEWRLFQHEVAEGRARYDKPCTEGGRKNSLTHSKDTHIIHMRPHGRVACDEYLDPHGNRVTKQSFWLNAAFVWELVKESDAFPPPRFRET